MKSANRSINIKLRIGWGLPLAQTFSPTLKEPWLVWTKKRREGIQKDMESCIKAQEAEIEKQAKV